MSRLTDLRLKFFGWQKITGFIIRSVLSISQDIFLSSFFPSFLLPGSLKTKPIILFTLSLSVCVCVCEKESERLTALSSHSPLLPLDD